MKKFSTLVITSLLASTLVVGGLVNASFAQGSSPSQVKTQQPQAADKPKNPQSVEVVLDGATLHLALSPLSKVLYQSDKISYQDAPTVVLTLVGRVRMSIEESGKETLVLKADKATIKYPQPLSSVKPKS